LKITKWPHFVIFKGCFLNAQPHFQHGCIGIFKPPVLLFGFGSQEPDPDPYLAHGFRSGTYKMVQNKSGVSHTME